MARLKYPVGIQSFPEIRDKGFYYVDKTEYIYSLVDRGKYYFLSRPRRFGKSLLLSTIKAFFEGKRELFEGLAISGHDDVKWEKHPVILIDLNAENYSKVESLEARIDLQLRSYEEQYNIDYIAPTLSGRFITLIKQAHEKTGKQVAILIDEYDKPILDTLHDEETANAHRDNLRGFYSVLKSADDHICFALLTGITKFGHLNIFSGLNNLNDISLDDKYAPICGITESELNAYFRQAINDIATKRGESPEVTFARIKENYDGYHFSENCPDIYNPFSLLTCLDKESIKSYWFLTGTPSFLVKLLKRKRYDLAKIDGAECEGARMYGIDAAASDPVPVLYQSGYLTIKGYDSRFDSYTLGFPNFEVKEGFLSSLLPFYTGISSKESEFNIRNFVNDLENGDAQSVMERVKSLFATIPYEMKMEKEVNFQNVTYLLFTLMGVYTKAEFHTSNGRIDVIVRTELFIYIIEIKIDSSPEIAIAQINEKAYDAPFASTGKKIFKIGANFSTQTRTLSGWIIE